VAKVLDDTRRGAVEADETEAAHDAPRAELGGEQFLIAEAILKRDHAGIGTEQRRDEGGEGCIGRGLEGDEDHVARAHFLRRAVGVDAREVKIAILRADGEAVAAHGSEIAPHQEMDVATGVRKLRPIIPPERAGADDAVAKSVFHRRGF